MAKRYGDISALGACARVLREYLAAVSALISLTTVTRPRSLPSGAESGMMSNKTASGWQRHFPERNGAFSVGMFVCERQRRRMVA